MAAMAAINGRATKLFSDRPGSFHLQVCFQPVLLILGYSQSCFSLQAGARYEIARLKPWLKPWKVSDWSLHLARWMAAIWGFPYKGYPKESSILVGFSLNHPFWDTPLTMEPCDIHLWLDKARSYRTGPRPIDLALVARAWPEWDVIGKSRCFFGWWTRR